MSDLELYILKNIESGNWKKGQRIPKEKDLMDKFHLSKATVRKVIYKFVNKELLFSIQGSGVFVSNFFDISFERRLRDKLKSDKVIYFPTKYQPSQEVYSNSPFTIENLTSENSFQFIKIYFSNSNVQAYSINWVIKNNKVNYSNDEQEKIIYGKETLFSKNILNRSYHKILFTKTSEFDKKLLRTNLNLLPIKYIYYLDNKNDILMIRVLKIVPKYFNEEYIKFI